ncbi:MAG TPA: hypothetical protein VFX35_01455 [Solirubrobacterales bacterium]|nr:hypothetical protein [Solirubrobacterales bacterium]
MTREEKIAKARELRAQGKRAREIAEAVDAPESTVRNWYLGGNCEGCGKPVDGGAGDASSKRCASCAARASAIWSRARIIERIQAWAARYGSPPTAYDWGPDRADRAGSPAASLVRERYEAGDWPAFSVVTHYFSSWNEAIRSAGFDPRRVGERGPDKLKVAA